MITMSSALGECWASGFGLWGFGTGRGGRSSGLPASSSGRRARPKDVPKLGIINPEIDHIRKPNRKPLVAARTPEEDEQVVEGTCAKTSSC